MGACLLSCSLGVQGVHVFDAYRMFSMERANTLLGSTGVAVNSLAAFVGDEEQAQLALGSSGGRKALIIPFDKFRSEALIGLNSSQVAGVVVVLPDRDSQPASEALADWKKTERELYDHTFDFPVYFVRESSIQNLIQDLRQSQGAIASSFSDDYQLVVSGDLTAFEAPSVASIHGWLVKDPTLPTVAVVAHYDTFAVAPGLATGADSNGSGLVALLELVRLFSRLYSIHKSPPPFNLLFVITGGGRLNFVGSKNWLNTVEPQILERLEFVLCLDNLSGVQPGTSLFLHASRPAKDPTIANVFKSFSETAQSFGITLEFVHKKINITDPDVYWEHEQFSRKKIAAATLSSLDAPVPLLTRSDVFDSSTRADAVLLEKKIQYVAEALAKYLYNTHVEELTVFDGSNAVSSAFVASWIDTVSAFPRAEFLVGKDSTLLLSLQRLLEDYTADVSFQRFLPESDYKFAGPTVVTLMAYKVKPFVFDLLITLAVLAYLATLFTAFKGKEGLWQLLVGGSSSKR